MSDEYVTVKKEVLQHALWYITENGSHDMDCVLPYEIECKCGKDAAITALSLASEHAEKQEPVAWLVTYKAESKHGLKQQRQMANLLDVIPDEEAGWTMTKLKSEPLYTHPALAKLGADKTGEGS